MEKMGKNLPEKTAINIRVLGILVKLRYHFLHCTQDAPWTAA